MAFMIVCTAIYIATINKQKQAADKPPGGGFLFLRREN